MQYKIVISHPTGNANVRRCVNGLYKANMLHSFHTSIACFPNTIFYKVGVGPLAFIKKEHIVVSCVSSQKFTQSKKFCVILRNLEFQ